MEYLYLCQRCLVVVVVTILNLITGLYGLVKGSAGVPVTTPCIDASGHRSVPASAVGENIHGPCDRR